MNERPPPEPTSPFDQRVSDRDRDLVTDVLRRAAGDGRLSLNELDVRLEACFAALTYGDLARLVADLPGQEHARDVLHSKRTGGNLRYEGPWLVPRRLKVEVSGGSVLLDFTAAIVTWPVCEVDVGIDGGSLRLVVPDGCTVDADEVEIEGGSVVHRHDSRPPSNGPTAYRIHVTGRIAGGKLVVKASDTGNGAHRRM
jgi:hypothetical protein